MRHIPSRFGLLAIFMAGIFAGQTRIRAADPATAPAASPLHDHIVAQYISGKWDELSAELTADIRETATLPPAQKADVDYIRRTMAECRPAWWKIIKAGTPVRFRPTVWGHLITATYEPTGTQNVHINYVGSNASVVFYWDAKDMDDPKVVGELEFTKGERIDEYIWNTLGSGASWTEIPPRAQINLSDEARQQLVRYLNFRGKITGAYYAMPRARRWCLWDSISGWSHEYDKDPNQMARKAVGILFAEEVLAHPEIYTTVPRPREPPADGAESKMIWELQEWIRHHDISLAEEKSFREAIKSFATVNDLKVRATGKVMLPNALALSLDPTADKPLAALRDAWIKGRYANAPGPATRP